MNNALIKYTEPAWINNISYETLEKLAGLGYSPEQIALYFRIPKKEFLSYYIMLESPLKESYERGVLFWKAKDAMRMLDESTGGNVMQGIRMDKKKNEQEFQNTISEMIYGDI